MILSGANKSFDWPKNRVGKDFNYVLQQILAGKILVVNVRYKARERLH
jgi:hypothetical protein